ncbi:hypothetical protein, partial [Gordonia sp. ABSL49_1]|uniref:hypothetical protein n=1 Tax=Gordonia sp. ABSL49_1 TaxID=2920941 RepID=UPI001F0EDE4D
HARKLFLNLSRWRSFAMPNVAATTMGIGVGGLIISGWLCAPSRRVDGQGLGGVIVQCGREASLHHVHVTG